MELLSPEEQAASLEALVSLPFDYIQLTKFDQELGGPSISTMNCNDTGRYHEDDRDVFRPLQYCISYFDQGNWQSNIDWFTRPIIHMSSLHIESLIKRIGRIAHLPLGTALGKAIVRAKVDPPTWNLINQFVATYNAAKHDISHPKDTHMFSIEDAILAYIVCRKLGMRLYPLADLATDLTVFDNKCEDEL